MQQEKMTTRQPAPLINLSALDEDEDTARSSLPVGRQSQRRRWVILMVVVLLLLLLSGILLRMSLRGSAVTYQTAQAVRGDLTITVSATGPIQSGMYNLIFSGTGGKIDEIDVQVGQRVTSGQVLARLNSTALQDAVNLAQTAVQNAQASLNATIASANSSLDNSSTSISAAQTAVSGAEASQRQAKAQGQASIQTAQAALDNAQANLRQVTTTANQQKQQAATSYNATTYTATSDGTPTPPAPCPQLGTFSDPSALPLTCQIAYNTYLATVNQANSNVMAAQAQVNTARANVNQAKINAQANAITAQNQVNAAENQLKSAQAGVNVTGASGQSQVVTAQDQLNTALAQLVQARHNLANATLTAPHDGMVTIINGTIGGSPGVSASGPAGSPAAGTFIQIVDLTALQVQSNVNEADMANVRIGEHASFTVNAYGSQAFAGTISALPPVGQIISNVVTYPIVIDVDQRSLKGAHLLPSMTANVTINAVQHTRVLLLPVNAINFARLASSGNSASGTPQLISAQAANIALNQAREELGNLEVAKPDLVSQGPLPAFVIEKVGQQYRAKPVVLGLTDGTSYEVLQGLSLGEAFLVEANG